MSAEYCENAQKPHGRISLLKRVAHGVGLRESVLIQTTERDESGRLLLVRSTDIFEIFTENVGVVGNGVAKQHNTREVLGCATTVCDS